ncbi:MAG TPA: preprotein translocase subunit YajC [Vicinamibacterales bacterium]|jgi:preprotein translocase subunit YajC
MDIRTLTDLTAFAMGLSADGGSSSALIQLLPFVLVLAIFYFIILLPMKRKQKKVQEFLDALKVGDKVVTTSGFYGNIVKLSDRTIQLQLADKVRVEVARNAIGGYQGQEPVQSEQPAAQ